eukprot:TRINITY_DN8561_c0_g1_i2.p1 TRINITY_DN8561_c0_g1~~TRINITY_DN8561_c0_g1_i2.p1  ORF type:complete len:693 (-),score=116.94 TRINITY_DN8561_c0_g1_i2:294-2372(-)
MSLRRGLSLTLRFRAPCTKCVNRIHTSVIIRDRYKEGPDQVLPADSIWTSQPDGAVTIRKNAHKTSNLEPLSVWTLLNRTKKRAPDRIGLAVKRNGTWVKWTYSQYLEDVKKVAKAFIHLGLERHHAVNILGFNAPEWHISNVASIVAGGLATGIYSTNSPEAVKYVAAHSRGNIMVLEDELQLDKVRLIQESLPHLKQIIQYTGKPNSSDIMSWQDVLDLGETIPDNILQERLEVQAVNQPCMLVYTSGTTGDPKGVMLSQDNITFTARVAQERYGWQFDAECGVSYLPLSHVAAQLTDIYLAIFGGGTVWFADKTALQGSLVDTLREVNPTIFIGVPRVWEKMEERIREFGAKRPPAIKKIINWAKTSALDHHLARMQGKSDNSFGYKISKNLFLKQVHKSLGLENAVNNSGEAGFFTAAAPLSSQTLEYFLSLDIPILEIYGSSESGGPTTSCTPGAGMRANSVGTPWPHFDLKIGNPDATGEGEIMLRGRGVCMGYLWEQQKTSDLMDSDGWILTGDLGRIDSDGFLFITGRIKEIIITGGGENIAPVGIEDCIKAELDQVAGHVMLLGDKRKFLSCILTLRTVLDERFQPTETLHPDVQKWLQQYGCTAKTAHQVISNNNPSVRCAIEKAIERANVHATSKAQRVQKFMISPAEFSLDGGELTPTLKVKRHFVLQKYKEQIDALYQE